VLCVVGFIAQLLLRRRRQRLWLLLVLLQHAAAGGQPARRLIHQGGCGTRQLDGGLVVHMLFVGGISSVVQHRRFG
jgi:hypothetical protein